MTERRTNERRPAYWAGKITFNRRQSLLDCLVRNASDCGAKLVLTGTTFVPREFELVIAKSKAEYRARVMWRQGEEVGIQFEQATARDAKRSIRRASEDQLNKDNNLSFRATGQLTPMGLIRWLKKLRQQHAAMQRRLLLQCD